MLGSQSLRGPHRCSAAHPPAWPWPAASAAAGKASAMPHSRARAASGAVVLMSPPGWWPAGLAERYRRLSVRAVLLAWDAETATGRPRVPNETVATACLRYPDVFIGIGSVDPRKGELAVAEVANIASLGLRGVKFHPSLQ